MAALSSSCLYLCICAVCTLRFAASDSALSPLQSLIFLKAIESQCPTQLPPPSTPLEVDGESYLQSISGFEESNAYISMLFYASWCPFSRHARYTFDVLSSMFPQITHVVVEESKAMPVIFSKYGIHRLPSILIMNQTSIIRYYGSKDLNSLVQFYKRNTGFEAIEHFASSQPITFANQKPPRLWDSSPSELLGREPYLVFSLLFLCLKGLLHFFPQMLSHVKAFCVSYIWHPNLGIFRETCQLLEHVLHVIDVKRVWSKLRLCKTRNFHNGAKNARVWASSLTSVS